MSPTPEPQGVYEDEEDEEPPNSLTMGFDHTRRWGTQVQGIAWVGGSGCRATFQGPPPPTWPDLCPAGAATTRLHS